MRSQNYCVTLFGAEMVVGLSNCWMRVVTDSYHIGYLSPLGFTPKPSGTARARIEWLSIKNGHLNNVPRVCT